MAKLEFKPGCPDSCVPYIMLYCLPSSTQHPYHWPASAIPSAQVPTTLLCAILSHDLHEVFLTLSRNQNFLFSELLGSFVLLHSDSAIYYTLTMCWSLLYIWQDIQRRAQNKPYCNNTIYKQTYTDGNGTKRNSVEGRFRAKVKRKEMHEVYLTRKYIKL